MVQFGMEMTFGDWLKVRRRQLDLTQKALAYEAGCGLGTLRKLENGSRRPSAIRRVIAWFFAPSL
jgi:transcriptional regulator with XRE-family HTH domain